MKILFWDFFFFLLMSQIFIIFNFYYFISLIHLIMAFIIITKNIININISIII